MEIVISEMFDVVFFVMSPDVPAFEVSVSASDSEF